jgi:signal transduction histidine kinase
MRMISHDLRNPIHTIGMAASLLADASVSDEKRSDQIEVIRRTADDVQRLAGRLLDLNRIEAHHGIPIEPEPVGLPPLLEEGYSLFQPQANTKGVELVLNVSADLPQVHGDPERILQVLWNLTGNAIKFAPQDGRGSRPATG